MAPAQEIGVASAITVKAGKAPMATTVSRWQPAPSVTPMAYDPGVSPSVSAVDQLRSPSTALPEKTTGSTPPFSTTEIAPGLSTQAKPSAVMVQSNTSTPSTVSEDDVVHVPSSTVTV